MRHLTKLFLYVLLIFGYYAFPQMNIRVRGKGIDIENVRSAGSSVHMYSMGISTQWTSFHKPGERHLFYDNNRPAQLVNKDFATTCLHAGDTRTDYAVESFSADAAGTVTIAVPTAILNAPGWTNTSISFFSSITTFTLYTYNYTTPGTWVTVPNFGSLTTLVFAEKGHIVFDNPLPLSDLAEGVVIRMNTDPYNRSYIYDPDLIVLPNGNYIAGEKNRRYLSTNKGATWTQISTSYAIEHASSFYHNGAIYIIGDEAGNNNGRGAINKSTDGGYTWSTPTILLDNFRNSPSHVEIAQDRIWIAYENLPNPHTVNFLSASVNSDLMDANSWFTTIRQDTRGTGNETDMVLGRNGWPIGMPKGGPAVRALSATQAISEASDAFTLPGSNSKYTAKYDPVSDKYWALTSIGDLTATNRVGITLYSSTDLKIWKKEKLVLQGESSWMHGFNYPSMQFDGNDIIFVLRTAWENERGQAQRWHDADMFTFHRVRNFRDIVPPTASFEQPVGNTRIPVGNDLTVIVNANDDNGTILKADLYLNNLLVRSDAEVPFKWDGNDTLLQNMSAGYYTLKAIVTSSDSETITITTTFTVGEGPSEIAIQVEGEGYTKKKFLEDELLWNNRTYPIEDLPVDFKGFEFLQSVAQNAEGGTMNPLADGFVYLIGKESEIDRFGTGWSVVPNSDFIYNNNGILNPLVIFQHEATTNTPIDIPLVSGFTGAIPIAKTIQLETLGLDDNVFSSNQSFVVYPNPVKEGSFNLKLKGIEKSDISIFNLDGRLLFRQKYVEGTLKVNISKILKSGLYIIKANTENGRTFTKKIAIN